MSQISQKGFTVVEVLLVVIALTLLAGVGLYGYNSIKNKDSEKKETVKVAAPKKEASVPKEYVELPDLGVKFEKTQGIQDFSFEVDPSVPSTKYVHSTQYTAATKACGWNDSEYTISARSIAAIGRENGVYDEDSPQNIGVGLVKQFKGFYIRIGHPNGAILCNNEADSEKIAELRTQLSRKLDEALQTIQEIN